jgi:hypothetical protein
MNETRPLYIKIAKTEPPPVLYKYFPPERMSVIESQEVHFSSPSKLNDAFDTYHLLPRAANQKIKWGRSRLRNEMGVLCLTESADNHLMWVNYARNHTGFVVGFDATSAFFEEGGRELRKVNYQARPPFFAEADENSCFYKSPEWRYEEEWRCIRRFGKDERRIVTFEWPMVKEIIFGHRIAPWMISRIVHCATLFGAGESTPMPRLFSSVPLPWEWKFGKEPQNYTMCDKCDGDGYLSSPAKGD